MKFENTITSGWQAAFRGMRNPKNSWHLSDSIFGLESLDGIEQRADLINPVIIKKDGELCEYMCIGEKDLHLATSLIRAGSEHRKFLRMIHVQVDITAPLYW